MITAGGFCEGLLERVDDFLSGFDPTTDERYGGTVVAGGGAELPGGMNALTSASADPCAFLPRRS